jgi:hypothetical protein
MNNLNLGSVGFLFADQSARSIPLRLEDSRIELPDRNNGRFVELPSFILNRH